MNAGRRTNLLAVCVLVVAVTTAYGAALSYGFVKWDDDINIYRNPRITSLSAENVSWMFTDIHQALRYKPLNWLAWAVVHALSGMQPAAYHFVNLALHAANAVLLFSLLKRVIARVTSEDESSSNAILASGVGALVWAVHPMRAEPVAWATGLPYCLATFFMLVSARAYLDKKDRLAIAAFALSMLTYPICAGFVAALVIWDAYFAAKRNSMLPIWRDPEFRADLWRKIPYFAVVFVLLGITVYARLFSTGEIYKDAATIEQFTVFDRAMQAFYVWTYYLSKWLLPINLTPAPGQLISFDSRSMPFIAATIFICGATAAFFWKRKSMPGLLALWLAYLAFMVPALGLTEKPHFPSDRYSYVSSIVFSIPVALGALHLLRILPLRSVAILSVVLVGALCARSFQQTQIWRDTRTLLLHMAANLQDSEWKGGVIYVKLGEYETDEKRYPEAIVYLQEAVRLSKTNLRARYSLGYAQFANGDVRAATETMKTARNLAQWMGDAKAAAQFSEKIQEIERSRASQPH